MITQGEHLGGRTEPAVGETRVARTPRPSLRTAGLSPEAGLKHTDVAGSCDIVVFRSKEKILSVLRQPREDTQAWSLHGQHACQGAGSPHRDTVWQPGRYGAWYMTTKVQHLSRQEQVRGESLWEADFSWHPQHNVVLAATVAQRPLCPSALGTRVHSVWCSVHLCS